MLLALENLSDKRWVVTVYAKTAASTYRLIQHFNVPKPKSTFYQEYSATLEVSGDGRQLVVSGLEEYKMYVYEWTGERFVLTSHYDR